MGLALEGLRGWGISWPLRLSSALSQHAHTEQPSSLFMLPGAGPLLSHKLAIVPGEGAR